MELSDRIGLWVASRRPRQSDVRLNQNNIYIFPSRVGLSFLVVLLIMLLTAINYQSSLIYLFAFFLGALFFISIWLCFLNLSGLQIHSAQHTGCFVGEPVTYEISLLKENVPCFALYLVLHKNSLELNELPAGELQTHSVMAQPKPRGVYQLDRLYLRSDYPFGFIKAWTWLNLTARCYVYPKPIDGHSVKEGQYLSETDEQQARSDELSDIKAYQAGENSNRILWKRFAAKDELAVRDYEQASIDSSWVRWSDYNASNPELRLSYLCFEVLSHSSRRQQFGLELPGQLIQPSIGEAHKLKCLQALAAFKV